MASTSATDKARRALGPGRGTPSGAAVPTPMPDAEEPAGIAGSRENREGRFPRHVREGSPPSRSIRSRRNRCPLYPAPHLSIGSIRVQLPVRFLQTTTCPAAGTRRSGADRGSDPGGAPGEFGGIGLHLQRAVISSSSSSTAPRRPGGGGWKNVLVNQRVREPAPLDELLPFVDAITSDLSRWTPPSIVKICGGDLDPVRATIRTAAEATTSNSPRSCTRDTTMRTIRSGRWSTSSRRRTGRFPLHISRLLPDAPRHRPSDADERLASVSRIARERLPYVYVGTCAAGAEDTVCPVRCDRHPQGGVPDRRARPVRVPVRRLRRSHAIRV